jgi:hypothetical protein
MLGFCCSHPESHFAHLVACLGLWQLAVYLRVPKVQKVYPSCKQVQLENASVCWSGQGVSTLMGNSKSVTRGWQSGSSGRASA